MSITLIWMLFSPCISSLGICLLSLIVHERTCREKKFQAQSSRWRDLCGVRKTLHREWRIRSVRQSSSWAESFFSSLKKQQFWTEKDSSSKWRTGLLNQITQSHWKRGSLLWSPKSSQKLRLPLLFLPLIRFLARSQPFGPLAEKVLEKQPEEPSVKSKSFEEQNGAASVQRSGFLGMRSQLDLTLC